MIYSLDIFLFLGMEAAAGRGGAPLLPHEMIELVQRPGVNGTGFILLGSKGFAFPMRTWIDCPNEDAANNLMFNYRSTVGDDLKTIVFRSIDYNTKFNVQYCVIGVSEDRLETMANITGGLNVTNGTAGVILHAVWHLVPVAVEP